VDAAELQAVLNAEPAFLDGLARDVSAIGGAHVLEEDAVAGVFDAGVALGDGAVVDDDVVESGASDIGEAGADGEGLDFGAEGDAEIGIGGSKANRFGGAIAAIGGFLVAGTGGLAENLHVGDVDGFALGFFAHDEFSLGIAQVDKGDGGFESGAEPELRINDFAVEEVDACRRRDVGDVDFTGFAAQTESLNLFSDTKKISEFDRVPAQIGKHA